MQVAICDCRESRSNILLVVNQDPSGISKSAMSVQSVATTKDRHISYGAMQCGMASPTTAKQVEESKHFC